MQLWVEFAIAALWPLTTLVLVLSLRRPIGAFLSSIGGRITSLSVLAVSVDLAAAKEADPPWIGAQGLDVRGLTPAGTVHDSYFMTLRAALWAPGRADYFIVDLKSPEDRAWLSSRLYLFTYLLKRMKGVRAVVFLATVGDVRRSFVGIASADSLLVELGRGQPWYPLAAWHAEAAGFLGLPGEHVPAPQLIAWWRTQRPGEGASFHSVPRSPLQWTLEGSSTEAAPPVDPINLAQLFLQRIQRDAAPAASEPAGDWIEVVARAGNEVRTWELAHWLHVANIEDELSGALDTTSSVVDSVDWSAADRVRVLGRTPGQFVALTSPSGRFLRLIDRTALLQAIGEKAVEPR